jgi:hypothetical protein
VRDGGSGGRGVKVVNVDGVSADPAGPGLARDGGTYRHLDAASGVATDGDVEEYLPRAHAARFLNTCGKRREKHQTRRYVFEAPPAA